ncbi:MAG: NosD domain-containing protein [Dehalococcoidia bacterium]
MVRLKTWKGLLILIALALVLALGAVAVPMAGTVQAQPNQVWVDDTGPSCPDTGSGTQADPYCRIQDGVDNVAEGGTVHVAAGTYNETVDIDRSLTLQGEGRDVVTVDAQGATDNVFSVNATYVTISGFTITGADRWGGYAGVYLDGANHCEISHNIITGNGDGIYLYDSHHNTITDNIVSDNWEEWWISCPFVYSWNGQEYQFDSDVFSGAIVQAFERTDYDKLEHLTPVDGEYLLKVTEELDETGYMNELKLIVVDHPAGTEIIPDHLGNIHTLRAPYAPIAGEEDDGTECLDNVTEKDGVYWSSNLANKDFNQEEDLIDGITLTFEKPTDAESAKVVLNYKFSELSELPGVTIFKLLGEKLDDWYDELNSNPSEVAKLRAFSVSLGRLHLAAWNGSKWIHQGIFAPPGPWIARDVIKTIDVSGIEGETIGIRLVSTTGLVLIDSVRMDYSADEAVTTTDLIDGVTKCTDTDNDTVDDACVTLLSATTAVDNNGIDVAPEILSDDDDYLTMEKGDYAHLGFDEVPPNPDYDRSYIVKATGYYKSLVPAEGEAHEEMVERLLTDIPFARRYFLERYASGHGHSGIVLYLSSDNIISSNEIANNYGYWGEDGISAYASDDNRIMDNNIYGNWAGIFLQACEGVDITGNNIHNNDEGIYLYDSHNNDVLRNDILENTGGFYSGIHVGFNCTGTVINCNNIVGNSPEGSGSYGVYNEPEGMLDARSNWWGCIEGPGFAGCDLVFGNVIYAPWLRDEFQNCRECREAPPPPGVPTVNHWGIVAMITLFAGLLVWAVRRRRLAF